MPFFGYHDGHKEHDGARLSAWRQTCHAMPLSYSDCLPMIAYRDSVQTTGCSTSLHASCYHLATALNQAYRNLLRWWLPGATPIRSQSFWPFLDSLIRFHAAKVHIFREFPKKLGRNLSTCLSLMALFMAMDGPLSYEGLRKVKNVAYCLHF